MGLRHLLTIATCATGSFAAMMFFASPTRLDATDTDASATPKMVEPKLEADGVRMTLLWDGKPIVEQLAAIEPDAKLPITFVAVNTTDKVVSVHPTLAVAEITARSRYSRSPTFSAPSVVQLPDLNLNPGEKREINVETSQKFSAASRVSISIQSGEQTGTPLQLTVAGDPLTFGEGRMSQAKLASALPTPAAAK